MASLSNQNPQNAETSLSVNSNPAASGSGASDDPIFTDGIWFEDRSGELRLAGYGGQPLPDLLTGIELGSPSFPAFNGLSQVAFTSQISGPGIDFTNDATLFATDLNGELQLILREGDLFDVDDDPLVEDLRTINTIGAVASGSGQGGESASLNDSGQLVISLGFKDLIDESFVFSGGIFVLDLVPPGSEVDVDFDNDVDGNDLLILQRTNSALIAQWQTEFGNRGTIGATGQAIPEPSTQFLLMVLAAWSAIVTPPGKRSKGIR